MYLKQLACKFTIF